MSLVFQIFGSKSSKDLDCMCFVDVIPSIHESHKLCGIYNEEIRIITGTDKEVNSNLAVIKDGIILDTFKGTSEECNNSLYLTYNLHDQHFPNQIERLVERDIDLKLIRVCRFILTFWSRSRFRSEIKEALRGDIYDKIRVISSIDLVSIDSIGKNLSWEDYLKVMSFQLGQSIGLLDGVELYTKEDVSLKFPELSDFLFRRDVKSLKVLEKYKIELMDRLSKYEFIKTREEI